MATVLDLIITPALGEIGVLADGEVPSASQASTALAKLNALLDQWKAEALLLYTVARTTWTIASGTQDYLVGTGQVVNIARPVFVEAVAYQDTSISPTLEIPMGDPLTDEEWQSIRQKTQQSTLPYKAYYTPTFPYGTVSLWPVPTSGTLQGVLYSQTPIDEFAAVSTTVSLPPGYRRMLIKNLAVELGPSFQRQPDPMLVQQARESKGVVKGANQGLSEMTFEAAGQIGNVGPVYDIRLG